MLHIIRFLAACLIVPLVVAHGFATSVVLVATPNAIVVGADTKGAGSAPKQVVKVRLLKKRLIVACLGTEVLKRSDGLVVYDFGNWISQLDKVTGPKISTMQLAAEIQHRVPATFTLFETAIKKSEITKERFSSAGGSDDLVDFIVAGYEKEKPTAYRIVTRINWTGKAIEAPVRVSLEVNEARFGNFWIDPEGANSGVTEIDVAGGEQHKRFALRAPREADAIRSRGSLSLDQQSNIVRAFLGMEAEAEPKIVGFPITVITVPLDADGWIKTYKVDTAHL